MPIDLIATRSKRRRARLSRGRQSVSAAQRRPRARRFEPLESRQLLAGDLAITEFMAANDATLMDEEGNYSDWIEIHNSTTEAQSLAGWHLTDRQNQLEKWTFPDLELGAGQYVVVFASGADRGLPNLHTNFKLSSGGEYLALVRPDGTVAQDFGSAFPSQIEDVSFGIPDGGEQAAFLQTPTPGEPNGAARGGRVTFDTESGVFAETFQLTLEVAEPNATIHFTMDGTTPTEASPIYDGPIAIESTAHVQAIALAPGVTTPTTSSAWFMKMDSNLQNFSSNLPIVALENYGNGRPPVDVYQFSPLTIFEPDDATGRSSLLAAPDLSSRSGLQVRGTGSGLRDKASYKLEAWNEQNRDTDISPLGLPAESDWILYGPETFDRALIRNALMFELSNQLGRYAVRTRFVELFFNMDGGDLSFEDYRGVYVLMEKIKRGPDRVDIVELEPHHNSEPEISGGWLLKVDLPDLGDVGFPTDAGVNVLYVDPKESEVTAEQKAWIQNDFNAMFASLSDPDSETGYQQTIDVDAWLDHHILEVFAKNIDSLRRSAFIHKDRGGKYVTEPIWDFDRSIGSEDGRDTRAEGWNGTGNSTDYFGIDVGAPWWGTLFQDPDFKQRWIERWFELRQNILSEENIVKVVDSMVEELSEAQWRNFQRWPFVAANGGEFAPPDLFGWQNEIEHLKGWLFARVAWADNQFAVATISPGRSRLDNGELITMSANSGTIYYTTDGSDPRAPGGALNTNAIVYNPTLLLVDKTSPATTIIPTGDPDETGWQDVDFDDASWSPGLAAVGFDTDEAESAIVVDAGFTVREVHGSSFVRVTDLNIADAVLGGQDVVSDTTVTGIPLINFLDGGANGHFSNDTDFPDGGGDNFVIRATATMDVRVEGTYTFGISSDDGSRLRIDGADVIVNPDVQLPQDSFGEIFLTAGAHDLEFVMFERKAGAEAELFFALGEHEEFNDEFRLLGDETNTSFDPLIRTNIETGMYATSPSAYVRVPFSVSVETGVDLLLLDLQYDDGVAVYLNGTEIVRRNAPDLLDSDSSATSLRFDERAVEVERIDITAFGNLLREGENVLAIHGLNLLADNPDFLVVPKLIVTLAGRPISYSSPIEIVARAEKDGEWGPRAASRFFEAGLPDDASGLAITELQYNPHDPTAAERAVDPSFDNDHFEFVEIVNQGNHSVDLEGVRFTSGINFTFGNKAGVLGPGESGLIVQDRKAFETRYGTGLPVVGQYAGTSLNNGGEQIVLKDRFGIVIQQFRYDDEADWPRRADGHGSSLEVVDGQVAGDDAAHWRPSTEYGGSPGTASVGPVRNVVINELFVGSGATPDDRWELHNTTDWPMDISGWYLSDDLRDLFKYRLPTDTAIGGGQHLALDEAELGFELEEMRGGELWLMEVSGSTMRFADHVSFDAADPGVSQGRWPDGEGHGALVPMVSPTFADPNRGPLVGFAIITEVHYNPPVLPVIHEDFNDGAADRFGPKLGTWTVIDGRYEVIPNSEQRDTITILQGPQSVAAQVVIDVTIQVAGDWEGSPNGLVVFDYLGNEDYKVASVHAFDSDRKIGNRVRIGHRDENGWNFLDEVIPVPRLNLDTDINLRLRIDGSLVSVLLNGGVVLAYDFGSNLGGGSIGLGSKNGRALFDDVTVFPQFEQKLEFIELTNTTSEPVELTGWQLGGQVELTFEPGTTIAADGQIVVVGFDPEFTHEAERFRSLLGIDSSVVLVGPYRGELDNDGGSVQLMKPHALPGATGAPVVLIDRFHYDDRAPWPAGADGDGRSLGRKTVASIADQASSWVAQRPTPGSVLFAAAGDLNADDRIDADDIDGLVLALQSSTIYESTYRIPATVAGDLDLDGDVDFDDIDDFMALLETGAASSSASADASSREAPTARGVDALVAGLRVDRPVSTDDRDRSWDKLADPALQTESLWLSSDLAVTLVARGNTTGVSRPWVSSARPPGGPDPEDPTAMRFQVGVPSLRTTRALALEPKVRVT